MPRPSSVSTEKETMAEWVNPLISGISGVIGAVVGASTIILGKRFFDAEYLRYRDEKQRAECDHKLIESDATDTFCQSCNKVFSNDELQRLKILGCEHTYDVESDKGYSDNGYTVDLICLKCGRRVTDVIFRRR